MVERQKEAKTFWWWHRFWWNALKMTEPVVLSSFGNMHLDTPISPFTWCRDRGSREETFWQHAWSSPRINTHLLHCSYLFPNFYFKRLSQWKLNLQILKKRHLSYIIWSLCNPKKCFLKFFSICKMYIWYILHKVSRRWI